MKAKKANKVFVRVRYSESRILKENFHYIHLHAPMGRIICFEDENGVECNEDGSYKLKNN